MVPHPTASKFVPCPDGTPNWRCPNCGGYSGHWYAEEVVPGECVTNTLQEDKQSPSAPGHNVAQVQEEWWPGGGPIEEDVEEVDKEMDVGEVPPTRDLAPGQAPALLATLLVMAGIWVGGQGDQVARPAISSRARGEVPTIYAE